MQILVENNYCTPTLSLEVVDPMTKFDKVIRSQVTFFDLI
jgi:hypothetical protein